MDNLINKLVFEIDCSDEDQALGLRHVLSETLQHQFTAGIDEICSKHTSNTHSIRIPHLELDLGQFEPHTFDRHIMAVLLHRFEEALVEQLQKLSIQDSDDQKVLTEIESLFHFLETGHLAWWDSGRHPDFNRFFLHALAQNQQGMLRFLEKHEDNIWLWKRIARQLGPMVHEKLVALIPSLTRSAAWITKWANEIATTLTLAPKKTTPQLINQLVVANRVQINGFHKLEERSMQLFRIHIDDLVQQIRKKDRTTIEQVIEMLVGNVKDANDSPPIGQERFVHSDNPITSSLRSMHGGAVLLCQFLKPLFKNLGFYVDGNWQGTDSQEKAVHLINYMCTGDTNAPEHTLVLEKLLCGLPLNAPIPLDAKLAEDELCEADQVLESVIEHWKALKNTSITGLRTTFLQRECVFTFKDSYWNIHLDRKTVDVLLDKLPWGYSVLILPWNDYQIYVEW